MLKVVLPTMDPSIRSAAGCEVGDQLVHRYNPKITAEVIGFHQAEDATARVWLKVSGHQLPATAVHDAATLAREYQKAGAS